MAGLQDALEDLSQHLLDMERETGRWLLVDDIVLDNLQQQVDNTQVRQVFTLFC